MINTTEDTPRQFIKRFLSFSIGPFIGALIGLISVPITTRLISPDLFGQLSLFTTAYSLVCLILLLGLDQSFVRDYAEANDKEILWFSSFSLPFFLSLVFFIICNITWEPLSFLLFGKPEYWATFLLGATPILAIFHRYLTLNVRMQEKGGLYSCIHILDRLSSVVLTILFVVFFGEGLVQILLPVLGSFVISITLACAFRYIPNLINIKINCSIIRRQLSFGLPLLVASGFYWIMISLDKVALRTWSSFFELGIYGVAFRLSSVLLIVQQSFTTFWSPTAYRWNETGVPVERFQKVTNTVALGLTMIFSLLLPSRWVLVWLLGPEYRQAVNLVPLTAVFPVMLTLSETTVIGIGFTRKTYWATFATLSAALANILGNWLLVPRFGAIGAAISTAITYSVYFWARTLISNMIWKKLELKYHVYCHIIIIILIFNALYFADWKVDLLFGGVFFMIISILLCRQYIAKNTFL